MTRRTIATMTMTLLLVLAAGGAEAGTLRDGVWAPTGCGPEPTPPEINGSGRNAYEASVKEAQAFQATAKQYNDCYFKEGQADSNVIGAAITDHQHQLQAEFDKLSADSKATADRLNKASKKQ